MAALIVQAQEEDRTLVDVTANKAIPFCVSVTDSNGILQENLQQSSFKAAINGLNTTLF